jgi:hypothetical protein
VVSRTIVYKQFSGQLSTNKLDKEKIMNRFQIFGVALLVIGMLCTEVGVRASNGHSYKSNTSTCSTSGNQDCPPCDNGTISDAYTYSGATYNAIEASGTEDATQDTTYCLYKQECLWTPIADKQCSINFYAGTWACNSHTGLNCNELNGVGPAVTVNVTSYTDIHTITEG